MDRSVGKEQNIHTNVLTKVMVTIRRDLSLVFFHLHKNLGEQKSDYNFDLDSQHIIISFNLVYAVN